MVLDIFHFPLQIHFPPISSQLCALWGSPPCAAAPSCLVSSLRLGLSNGNHWPPLGKQEESEVRVCVPFSSSLPAHHGSGVSLFWGQPFPMVTAVPSGFWSNYPSSIPLLGLELVTILCCGFNMAQIELLFVLNLPVPPPPKGWVVKSPTEDRHILLPPALNPLGFQAFQTDLTLSGYLLWGKKF